MHSQSFYKDVNQVVNQAYMPKQKIVVEDAKVCPTEVLSLITKAMKDSSDETKQQAREKNQGVEDSKMKKVLDDLMDACPGNFPAAGETEKKEDEQPKDS